MIVEDNRTNLMMIEMLVRKVPDCVPIAFTDPLRVTAEIEDIGYDIGIIDYQMPGMDGISLVRALREAEGYRSQPLVILTADRENDIRIEALQSGAVEFLHKPIDPVEFKARLTNLVQLSEAQRKLEDQAAFLRSEVEKATLELRRREEEIIQRLSVAAGYKDRETAQHTIRMARYCALLATEFGFDEEARRDLFLAAQMHDIGKVGIRDGVLLKPGRLDDDERAHMTQHAVIGGDILAGSRSELLRLAATIALTHHERWDGAGYPKGLAGTDIPLVGRIAAIADVFDALTSERPYKAAWPVEKAVEYIRDEAGRQFDPDCVKVFLDQLPGILAIREEITDEAVPVEDAA